MLCEFEGRGEFTSEMGSWCPELGWHSSGIVEGHRAASEGTGI